MYGAAYLQKKSLFEDLMRYLERPIAFSPNPKFKIVRFQFESVTTMDDCVDELIQQGKTKIFRRTIHHFLHLDFFRTRPWINDQQSVKHLLFLVNIQNSVGGEMLNMILNNSQSASDACQKLSYSREENSSKY